MNFSKHFNFTYSYHDEDRDNDGEYPTSVSLEKHLTFDECATWDAVLKEFLLFLGHVYGYDITDQVSFMTLEDRLDRIREKNNLSSDWPYDEEDSYDEGEAASKV